MPALHRVVQLLVRKKEVEAGKGVFIARGGFTVHDYQVFSLLSYFFSQFHEKGPGLCWPDICDIEGSLFFFSLVLFFLFYFPTWEFEEDGYCLRNWARFFPGA